MKTGIELIAKERQEQINKHGRSVNKDVELNKNNELTTGAIALIRNKRKAWATELPLNWDDKVCAKMSRKSYKNRLIIAGALIAAEIDRLMAVETINKRFDEDK